jgi:hypothetical protein
MSGMIKIVLLLLLLSMPLQSQFKNKDWNLTFSTVYTTSAKIYLNPNSSDLILRNNYFPLQGIVSFQAELMYKLDESILLGLCTEYMNTTSSGYNITAFSGNNTVSVLVQDGFQLVPVELSGYYILPFSTERFKFLMGGGIGFYIGEQIRKFGDVQVTNVSDPIAYGIHVILTMDYLVSEFASVRGEMKFRDPEFNVTSKYDKTDVNYNGSTIHLGSQTFDSKINVDGISFIIGASFHF